MKISYKKYIIFSLILILMPLLALGVYVYKNDPYWLFKSSPRWNVMHNGHNRVLDIRMRFVKSLQVVMRQPEIVVIGSSRIYRGIQTSSHPHDNFYNLGISNMRIREAYAFIIHAVRWAPVSEIILGLDYFMFDTTKQWESGFDPSIRGASYLLTATPTSLITKMAYDDVQLSLSGVRKGDGYWTRNGFKITNPRTAKASARVLKSFYNSEKIITLKEFEIYENILEFVKRQNVRISVYISPMNRKLIKRMTKKKRYTNFNQWKNTIRSISLNHGVEVHDFSETNPFFNYSIRNGSTKYWIDASHYSPFVGDWILNKLGILGRSVNR